MPPILKYLTRRLLAIPVTLLIVTSALYGVLMLAPAETRAQLYVPKGTSHNPHLRPEVLLQNIIADHGLNDPYPVQYARWISRLLRGDWGWGPQLRGDVLEALLTRTPATVELTLYSILLFLPLGIISGVFSAWKQERFSDHGFRLVAFAATSIPPFILALVLLSVFYAGLRWFPPGRLTLSNSLAATAPSFKIFTGLLTLDGLLNGRPDISADALRHLILPAFTLSLAHWATLGRITRASMIEELGKDYIVAARGRGLGTRSVIWRHALSNALVPALNSMALSAASLLMGVFVVEAVFDFPGVSSLIVSSMGFAPDMSVAMGFAVYSVLLVMPVMLLFDTLQALVNPHLREGVISL